MGRRVGEPPAREIHGRGRIVEQLDPVRRVAVFIRQSAVVLGEELVDNDARMGMGNADAKGKAQAEAEKEFA